jgi:PadR family transcriptional regulator, regulatory protein PadR
LGKHLRLETLEESTKTAVNAPRQCRRVFLSNAEHCLPGYEPVRGGGFPLALLQEILYRVPVEAMGERMAEQRIELPQGTLDLLILRTLALGPEHGWAISERIHQVSSKVLQVQQGSLYPALHRLERRGWIKARWGASENNRRAKFYELTASGRKQLEAEKSDWKKLAAAVAQVLETA